MNSRCGVQGKRKLESHESCVCVVGFSACGCQKKSLVFETETHTSNFTLYKFIHMMFLMHAGLF